MVALHEKYAPILHFNKDEQFYPMRVADMLAYSDLFAKGQRQPIVRRGELTVNTLHQAGNVDSFLRSVATGPLLGKDVIESWGNGALEMVYRWSAMERKTLPERLARKAYSWFSPKTAAATRLFWWNDLVQPVLADSLASGPDEGLPRLILPSSTHESALTHYQEHRPPYTYYHRQVRSKGFLCLQYWFFYSYNNWGTSFAGMNDHEGDWEGMMIFFQLDDNGRPIEPPAYITFADHESRQTKPWGHEDVTIIGSHPLGFVAAGSHATYPQAQAHALMRLYNLVDYATGDGSTIDHGDWRYRIDLDDARWLHDFGGSYGTRFWLSTKRARTTLQALLAFSPLGALARLPVPDEIELPGVSAPRGPLGPHRPQYADPVTWAGITRL